MRTESSDNDETEVEEVEKPQDFHRFDNTNPVSPVKKQDKILKKQVLPDALKEMNDFEMMDLKDSYEEMNFTDLKSKMRKLKSGQGARKFVNVRPLDRLGDPIGSATPY